MHYNTTSNLPTMAQTNRTDAVAVEEGEPEEDTGGESPSQVTGKNSISKTSEAMSNPLPDPLMTQTSEAYSAFKKRDRA